MRLGAYPTNSVFTTSQAATVLNITPQAVVAARRGGKLKGTKVKHRWQYNMKDLLDYYQNRYCRDASKYNGELKYDNTKGWYSPTQLARIFQIHPGRIYYALRANKLTYKRYGSSYSIHVPELSKFSLEEAGLK